MATRDAPTLLNVTRLDSIRLDRKDKTYFTDEGYFVDAPILTSCGIFEYANTDGSIRRELRLPQHVFQKKSLESYKGKPIIITHDARIVNKDNVDREMIGTIMSDGYKDGDDVRAEIIIHDTEKMKDCGFKELSLGYSLDLIEQPGEWNGEHYDAIQTNIVINHLALVEKARAGEDAHLNLDGEPDKEDGINNLKGGKAMKGTNLEDKNGVMSPEELDDAIKETEKSNEDGTVETNEDSAPKIEVEISKGEEGHHGHHGEEKEVVAEMGKTPEIIAKEVADRKDKRGDSAKKCDNKEELKEVVSQQDSDIDMLLAAIEKLSAKLDEKANADSDDTAKAGTDANNDQTDCGTKTDEDDTEEEIPKTDSKKTNTDAADIERMLSEKLSICRVGDKLRMDGLETLSIMEGKKRIINKVSPGIRLDGKSDAYIDAAYDMAVNEVSKKKDVNYQRRQMQGMETTTRRADAKDMTPSQRLTGALAARQAMIEREGGNA